MVDTEEFALLTPNLSSTRRSQILPPLQEAMARFEIVTRLREAHFMAQLLHESGGFRYREEIASGAAYEGRADLGNTHPGDGKRFKGRGWIQVTGRFNYRKFGQVLGLDLEHNPEQASTDGNAALIAAAYWNDRKLNRLADQDDINTITRRINGGTNGLADRRGRLVLAKAVLNADEPPQPDPEEPFRVTVDGKVISNEAYIEKDGHAWIPLRVVANALGMEITGITSDDAELTTASGSAHVPLTIRGKTGFSPAKRVAEVAGRNIDYDGEERVLAFSN